MKFVLAISAVLLLAVGSCSSHFCGSATVRNALHNVTAFRNATITAANNVIKRANEVATNATQSFEMYKNNAWKTINDVTKAIIEDPKHPNSIECISQITSFHTITTSIFRSSMHCVSAQMTMAGEYRTNISRIYLEARAELQNLYNKTRKCRLDQHHCIPECLAQVKDEVTTYSTMQVAEMSRYRSELEALAVTLPMTVLSCGIETGLSALPDDSKKVFSGIHECTIDFMENVDKLLQDLYLKYYLFLKSKNPLLRL